MNAPLIVVVDDDPDKRFLLERFLGRHFPENQVSSVANCAAAIPLIHAPIPKIVITNGRIAQKDGIEFAAYVAREVHAPVVMMSLRGELKQKALNAGVSDFVETGDDTAAHKAIAHALASVSHSDLHE